MKPKIMLPLCLIILVWCLSACEAKTQPDASETPTVTAWEAAQAIVEAQPNAGDYTNHVSMKDQDGMEPYLQLYGLKLENLTDASILYAGGISPYEVAVLYLNENGCTAGDASTALEEYIKNRTADFTGYAPEQAAILGKAQVLKQENVITLLVCADMDSAVQAFRAVFGQENPEQEEQPDTTSAAETPTMDGVENELLTRLRETIGTAPNAGDYVHAATFGSESFSLWAERCGIDLDSLADGAALWVGDGVEYNILAFQWKETRTEDELLEFFLSAAEHLKENGFPSAMYGNLSNEAICLYNKNNVFEVENYLSSLITEPSPVDREDLFGPTALSIARTVAESQPNAADYTETPDFGDSGFTERIEEYGLDPRFVVDGASIRTTDASCEIAILRSHPGSRFFPEITDGFALKLLAYIKGKGFQPTEKSYGIYTFGDTYNWAEFYVFFICRDEAAAWNAFQSRKGEFETNANTEPSVAPELDENGRVVYHSPGVFDMTVYDTTAILSAWHSGDFSGLSEKDQAILAAAKTALSEAVTESMTDYEKELAIHDWLVVNVTYDFASALEETNSDCTTPYGGLVKRSADCLGYTVSFQLLMDVLGIECQTVTGASTDSRNDHAWNLVCLDGEWYAVDLTWDDPVSLTGIETVPPEEVAGSTVAHKYFNVTSNFLRETDHQWSYDEYPEAEGIKYAWKIG